MCPNFLRVAFARVPADASSLLSYAMRTRRSARFNPMSGRFGLHSYFLRHGYRPTCASSSTNREVALDERESRREPNVHGWAHSARNFMSPRHSINAQSFSSIPCN